MKDTKDLVIAIDGHSSGGKSSFAKEIAKKLGITYVDSGAMYRAVALYAIDNHMIDGDLMDKDAIIAALQHIDIDILYSDSGRRYETWLNGKNIEDKIRGVEVSRWASSVSAIPEVRIAMVELQRKMAHNKGVVMDGRDIGTVVFPEADIKIFLTACAEVRAERRYLEMIKKGMKVSLKEVLDNINLRDHQDSTRAASPLKPAEDSVPLDNSHMTMEEQMEWFGTLFETERKDFQ